MATDLAEFVGAAIGLNLLFGVPLFPAGLITAVVAFARAGAGAARHRRFELAIAALLALVLLGFAYDLLAVGAQPAALAGGLVPSFGGDGGVLLAAGIIGATVMPHVVYLHSALTKARVACRDDGERRELLRFTRIDVLIGLGLAGLINLTMLVVAASLFGRTGRSDVDTIEAAHAGLAELVGGGAALAFAVALLASGLSSSSVGTYAGPGRHAGLHPPPDPAAAAPRADHAARAGRAGAGPAGHREPDRLAGGAVLRDAVRAGAAGAAHPRAGRDGRLRQQARARPSPSARVATLIIALNVVLLWETFL